MKKLMVIVFFLAPNFAYAALPDGCYVSYSNPNYCYNVGSYVDCYVDSNSNTYHYGSTVGAICNQLNVNYTLALTCQTGWQNCTNSLNFATDKALSLNTTVKKLNTLVNKLRKACGSRCSRIR